MLPRQESILVFEDFDPILEVDLLPGGGSVGPGPLLLPIPTEVVHEPNNLPSKNLNLPHEVKAEYESWWDQLKAKGIKLKD